MDATFTAEAEGGKGWNWIFMLDVYLEASYYQSGNIGDWDWDTLEIDKEETDEEQEEYDKHWYKEQKTVGGEMEKWLDTEPFEKDDEDLRLEPEDDEYEDGTEFEDDDLRLEPELDEQNTTGGGASFKAGDSMAYMTPRAFKKKQNED